MLAEELFLHIVRTILIIGAAIKGCLIWNYLSKKPLGMQTIFDQMIKDLIRLLGIAFITQISSTLKATDKPYNHYIALAIGISRYFTALSVLWQIFVTVVIRQA